MNLIVTALIVIGIAQVLCLLALVDQYKGLLQIREQLKLIDTSYDLELSGVGTRASAAGLPSDLSHTDIAVTLMFSTKCLTCYNVAESMKGRLPASTWAIITGSEGQCAEFQTRAHLGHDRVILDVGGKIVDKLRVHAFPSALLFVDGELRAAKSVPSLREFEHLLKNWNSDVHATALASPGGIGNGN